MKKIFRILKRVLLVFVSLLLLLMLLIYLFFKIPAIQNRMADKATKIASNTLNTDVKLGEILIVPPNTLLIHDLYLSGTDGDTLFSAGKISARVSLFKLIRKRIEINRFLLSDARIQILKNASDSSFNFQFNTQSSEASAPPPDTTKESSWTFDIDEVELEDVDFGFADNALNNNYKASVGFFNLTIDSLNPEQMAFYIGAIDLQNSEILIDYQQASTEESTEETSLPRIAVSEDVRLENVSIDFINAPSSQRFTTRNLNLVIVPEKIDLANNLVAFDQISLHDSFIDVKNLSQDTLQETDQQPPGEGSVPWTIEVAEADFENNTVQYVSTESPLSGKKVFNPENVQINDFSARIRNAYFKEGKANADIEQFSFKEHNHFFLKDFAGAFHLDEKGMQAQNVRFLTPKSALDFSLNTGKINFDSIFTTYPQVPFQLKLKNTHIHHDDIHYFYQDTSLAQYQEIMNQLTLNAQLNGAVNDLQIQKFQAQISNALTATVSGQVAGLPEIKKASGKLSIDSRFQSVSNMMKHLPDSLLPENLRIPDNLQIQADISGDYLASKGEIALHSNAGNLLAGVDFKQDTIREKEEFNLELDIPGLDLGAFYPMGDTLGKMFAQIQIKGQSSGFGNPSFDTEMQIDTLHFLDYSYTNFHLEGSYADEVYSGTAGIDDKNIVFSFDGAVDLKDSIPEVDFVFDMPGADFRALNLTEQDIRGGLTINSVLNGNNFDNSNGYLSIEDIVLLKENQRYELDSVVLRAKNKDELTHLTAQSELFNLDFEGNVKFSKVSPTLWDHLNLIFKMDTIPVVKPGIPKHFALNAEIKSHPLIKELFLPELSSFDGLNLEVVYDQTNSQLNINGHMPPIVYGSFELDSTHISIESVGKKLVAQLKSSGIERKPVFIPELVFETHVADNKAGWTFRIEDLEGKTKYAFSGKVSSEEAAYRSVLNTDSLLLNYEQWNISEENAILLYKDSLAVHDFKLSKGAETITLKQTNETKVIFDAFRLKTLTNMVTTNDLLDANVDGYFAFNKAGTTLRSELAITDIYLEEKPLFERIKIDLDQQSEQATEVSAIFSQKQGGAEIHGKLISDNNPSAKATISLNKFTLDNFKPFFGEEIKRLSGNLNGEITIANPSDKYDLNGNLTFSDTEIVPKMLGTSFRIDNSELILEHNILKFNSFTVTDAGNHKATLDGEISGLVSSPIAFDLDFESDNYTFLNAKEGDSELFYGNLTGDVSAKINGPIDQPRVQLKTTIKPPTDFSFIVPSTEYATVEREGLVVFVKEKDNLYNEILEVPDDTLNIQFSPGFDLDMTARISVEEEARLTIIVDPATGEQLSIKGTADLSYNMTDGAQQTLTGQYLLNSGRYTLTLYDVVKREFDIQENSSITWTGDVMDAQADLSATYEVRTSAEGLVTNEISNMNDEKRQQLSQPYPFLVTLNIGGELLQPKLDFDISLPQNVTVPEITNKLNQINQNESEVNKQAFALLVFGNFIQNNVSTSRPMSYELSATARSSVSKVLSTQLNRLAEKYVKGVDVNLKVNSYSDYSGNESQNTTNVKLDVRKQFFNDRLSVRVGGKVNIEGEEQSSNNLQRVAGDVVVLYDLTEDGRFKIKGFNTTGYENMLEGEIRKTGVGIIYNRDFYHFRNLFQADSLDQQRKGYDVGGGNGQKNQNNE